MNLCYGDQPASVMMNSDEWEDVEFDVALDSGCTDHFCADVAIPGYELQESPGSRRGQCLIIGDGGSLPNKGQKQLRLENR